jgi:hypothetical protein
MVIKSNNHVHQSTHPTEKIIQEMLYLPIINNFNNKMNIVGTTNKLEEVHDEQINNIDNKRIRDALEHIDAMRSHEVTTTTTTRVVNYLTPVVNATCRRLMIDWCFTVIDAFGLNRDTVGLAMSITDRYLSSNKGKSNEARNCTKIFQRSVITSLYMAIKIHEPTVLGLQLLVKLCRGVYTESEIIATELEILSALEWRVYISSMSIMEYVRHYVALLPEEYVNDTELILVTAARLADIAISDVYFSTCRTSSVAMACFAGALDNDCTLSSSDRDVIWKELSNQLNFDIASNEIRQVEKRLRTVMDESSTCCYNNSSRMSSQQATSPPRLSVTSADVHASSSPSSVMTNL